MKITTLLAIILIAIGIMASLGGYGFNGSAVSEPVTMLIFGTGINGLACAVIKRKKDSQI